MKLETSYDEYHDTASLVEKTRKKKVTLPTVILSHLIIDHSRMCAKLKSLGVGGIDSYV